MDGQPAAGGGLDRELRNCIEHAVARSSAELINVEDLPDSFADPDGGAEGGGAGDWPTLDEMERRYIDRVLSSVAENRSAAARILGIDRRTLMRKLASRRS